MRRCVALKLKCGRLRCELRTNYARKPRDYNASDCLAGVVKLVDTADLEIEHQDCESACVNPLKFGEPPGLVPRQRRAKPDNRKV